VLGQTLVCDFEILPRKSVDFVVQKVDMRCGVMELGNWPGLMSEKLMEEEVLVPFASL